MPSSIPSSYTDVARTALLVYDMQRGIANQISDGDRVIAACKTAIDAARRAGMRIAYTKHMSARRVAGKYAATHRDDVATRSEARK
jgi:biuret amidohydrolase